MYCFAESHPARACADPRHVTTTTDTATHDGRHMSHSSIPRSGSGPTRGFVTLHAPEPGAEMPWTVRRAPDWAGVPRRRTRRPLLEEPAVHRRRGRAALRRGSDVEMDDPERSIGGTNPDVLFRAPDGARWGLACRAVHGENPRSYFDLFVDGVDLNRKAREKSGPWRGR